MRINVQNTSRHMFASAAIIQRTLPLHIFSDKPQINLDQLQLCNICNSKDELGQVMNVYIKLTCDIAADHIPALAFMKTCVPAFIKGQFATELSNNTGVIALPVLNYNEQRYEDDIRILEYYETLIHQTYEKAEINITDQIKIHIGGDQLTGERFTQAKRLGIQNLKTRSRFGYLFATSFELFHLNMNFLEQIVFKTLFKEESSQEIGTMKSEAARILRNNVSSDVRNHFEADKDIYISFIRSYIVQALLNWFGMLTIHDIPTKNIQTNLTDNNDMSSWVYSTIGTLIDDIVL